MDHFVVTQSGNRIVLEPLEPSRADEVRARLKELEITEADVAKAIAWARERADSRADLSPVRAVPN
ncbi:MAG: AbrB/MazE/SpoVT family DNA-binding domain-containing protein [marine benthic group bacterium]|nr:AbrB/MazE/SpoVT family DNA-binding domain-containing protein [Gemmatimonadota bacterium]